MRLHCLGTAGYHPNELRHTSCYAVSEAGLVFDAGSGFFRLPAVLETDELDIVLSHAHLDHVVGLTYLLDVVYQRPLRQVRVWGAEIKLAAIRQHLFNEHLFPVPIDVQWCPVIAGQPIEIAGGVLEAFSLEHPGGSLGYRIRWPGGPRLAYVTDTIGGIEQDYVRKLVDCGLLVHECNFRDSSRDWALRTGHAWTSIAAEVARTCRASKLVLGHINPLETSDDPVGIADALKIFPQTIIATDGLVVEF